MAHDLVIGLDASTTACKAIVWDLQGSAVAEGRSPLTIFSPQPGWHEQSAESWWLAAVTAIQQAVAQVEKDRLAAICITAQRETFVPIDQSGNPLRNGILWMDERCRPLLPALEERLGRDHFHQLTGKPLSVNLAVGKIAWLKQNEPGIYDLTAKYLDVHAYIIYQLTSQYRTAWGCADPTGLFDMTFHQWSLDLLEEIGIRRDQLPDPVPSGAILGEITREAARSCSLPEGLPVVAGIGDGQACGLGTDITQNGDAYLTLGTSVVSGAFSEKYLTSRAFRTMCGGIQGSYLLETALMGGGYTLTWFIEQFLASSSTDIAPNLQYYDQLAAQVPPGCDGLVLVPYWNSVLGPYWDASARGIVVGWRGVHTPAHFYRAILEGIAYEQRLNTQGVETALGQPIRRFVVVGGGARSALWCQIIADVTGKPVVRAASIETAALGAGILAAAGAGLFSGTRQAARAMAHLSVDSFLPDPARHQFYSQVFNDIYQHLYPTLQPMLQKL